MISWKEMLLLLEVQTVHLLSPKNHYANDICISQDTPIFETGRSEITYLGRYNTTGETENEMMPVRWKIFKFHRRILEADQKEMSSCPKCFSDLFFIKKIVTCRYLSPLVGICLYRVTKLYYLLCYLLLLVTDFVYGLISILLCYH